MRPRLRSAVLTVPTVLTVLASLLAAACGPDPEGSPPINYPDARPADAGPPDAGPPDAGPPDATPPPPCENLPSTPQPTTQISYIHPIEDISFDDQGYIYWNEGDGIYRRTRNGQAELFVPNISFYANLRHTPDGNLWICNNSNASIERIDPLGVRTTVLTNVTGPNGMEVDPDNRIYVTEFSGGSVLRYDPATGVETTLNSGVVPTPNGITFSPAFDRLYYSTWGGTSTPTLWTQPIDTVTGEPGPTTVFVQNHGGSTINDGMAVDECGNVYVADSGGEGAIVRVRPDGTNPTVIVRRQGETLHNFVWGRGYGGWEAGKLYIVSLGVGLFEADVGARGKAYGPTWIAP